jgi:cytochrome c1
MRKLLVCAAAALILATGPASAAKAPKPPAQTWSFDGIFGTYDRASLRRGLQVYLEICASCHSLRLVAYRTLGSVGFSADEIKALAATFEVQDGPNDEGEMFTRPALPSDRFVSPYANDMEARSVNNGALPPDLSLITKARKGGPDYSHALLIGYKEEPPAGVEIGDGMHYNEYFPGHQIAMPAPLSEDAVEYADGTKATVEQMSKDLVTFLAWAAQPELEERKQLGISVMLFLIVLTAMFYALKRRIWADVH